MTLRQNTRSKGPSARHSALGLPQQHRHAAHPSRSVHRGWAKCQSRRRLHSAPGSEGSRSRGMDDRASRGVREARARRAERAGRAGPLRALCRRGPRARQPVISSAAGFRARMVPRASQRMTAWAIDHMALASHRAKRRASSRSFSGIGHVHADHAHLRVFPRGRELECDGFGRCGRHPSGRRGNARSP